MMHQSFDLGPFSDADAETIACSPLSGTLADLPSAVYVVKTLATGGTMKYRAHCDPNATLDVLRDTLHLDEDNIMSPDDRFHQGDFRVGKSAEPHTKWRDILQDEVIDIQPKKPYPAKKKLGNHSSPSSLPPATVPLYRLTRQGDGAQLYGNFANEKKGYNHATMWKFEGLVCRIWEKQGPGMVPLRRLYSPKLKVHGFIASEEGTNLWVEKEEASIEFTVGYVYRSDCPCPEGAVPLYGVFEGRIGRYLTLSASERDLCLRLGAKNLGLHCYVAPP